MLLVSTVLSYSSLHSCELQVFKFGTVDGKPAEDHIKHTYILQPVTGNAKYSKQNSNESANVGLPLQKAVVNLDDVTLCLPKVNFAISSLVVLRLIN